MGRKRDHEGQPTPGQRRLTEGWLETAEPELAAVLNAPGSRQEKRARLEAYLKARPKVEQVADPNEDGTDGMD